MSGDANRRAADELFAAWERWDLDVVASLLGDDAVDHRPQSGERFTGPTNIVGMYREVPGSPRIHWSRVRGGPELWVAEGTVEYGAGPVRIIGIVELADGLIVDASYYFADPFEGPEERRRWRD
jgi:hypothetical protein